MAKIVYAPNRRKSPGWSAVSRKGASGRDQCSDSKGAPGGNAEAGPSLETGPGIALSGRRARSGCAVCPTSGAIFAHAVFADVDRPVHGCELYRVSGLRAARGARRGRHRSRTDRRVDHPMRKRNRNSIVFEDRAGLLPARPSLYAVAEVRRIAAVLRIECQSNSDARIQNPLSRTSTLRIWRQARAARLSARPSSTTTPRSAFSAENARVSISNTAR